MGITKQQLRDQLGQLARDDEAKRAELAAIGGARKLCLHWLEKLEQDEKQF